MPKYFKQEVTHSGRQLTTPVGVGGVQPPGPKCSAAGTPPPLPPPPPQHPGGGRRLLPGAVPRAGLRLRGAGQERGVRAAGRPRGGPREPHLAPHPVPPPTATFPVGVVAGRYLLGVGLGRASAQRGGRSLIFV